MGRHGDCGQPSVEFLELPFTEQIGLLTSWERCPMRGESPGDVCTVKSPHPLDILGHELPFGDRTS